MTTRRGSVLEGYHGSAAYVKTSRQSHRHTSHGKYENTYELNPCIDFKRDKASQIIRNTLEKHLSGKVYDPTGCNDMALDMAEKIKEGVKSLGYSRHKVVSVVDIGQQEGASVVIASRCVWNSQLDDFAEEKYQNSSLYAIGVVYVLYTE